MGRDGPVHPDPSSQWIWSPEPRLWPQSSYHVLRASAQSYVILTMALSEIGTIAIPILQMRKLRL